MGAMLGIALADDLILLFVFWEMTSVTSFLLIGYRYEDDDAKAGALTALQVTALGGLAMLVGFLLVGLTRRATFSSSPSRRRPRGAPRDSPPWRRRPCSSCSSAPSRSRRRCRSTSGCPRAMVAPTPISAYLHAATMVKAGRLPARAHAPALRRVAALAPVLVAVGTTSMLLGAYQAFRETDLKAILARTTASALGMITPPLRDSARRSRTPPHPRTTRSYKGALFLVAGIVEHHAHTRELRTARRSPPRAAVAFARVRAALALDGRLAAAPRLRAKEAFYAAARTSPFLAARPPAAGRRPRREPSPQRAAVVAAGSSRIGVFLGQASARAPRLTGTARRALAARPLLLGLALAALGLGCASLGHVTTRPRRGDGVGRTVRFTSSDPAARRAVRRVAPRAGAAASSSSAGVMPSSVLQAGSRSCRGRRRSLGAAHGCASWARRGLQHALAERLAALVPLGDPLTLPALCSPGSAPRRASRGGRDPSRLAEMPWYGARLLRPLAHRDGGHGAAPARGSRPPSRTTTIGFLVSMLFVVYRRPTSC